MARWARRTVIAPCAFACLAVPVSGVAQEDLEAIEVILGYSVVEDVLEVQAESFLLALGEVLGPDVDLRSTGVEPIVREEFAPARMRAYVVEELRETSSSTQLEAISELLRDGAIGQVSDLVVAYEPPESFEAFVQGLQASPPPRERVELLSDLADAQQAAGFYLLLDETVREGAHRVASVVTGGESPPWTELTPSVEAEQLEKGHQFAVVSFLHRFRPVGDELVASATEDYRTESGRRYVERYSLALAESIQLAALRVAGRIGE